jgi:hypothetical protein
MAGASMSRACGWKLSWRFAGEPLDDNSHEYVFVARR